MLGLIAGIILVFSSSHIQETIHHGHTLVKALSWQLGQVTPGSHTLTRVSPHYLYPSRGLCFAFDKICGVEMCLDSSCFSNLVVLQRVVNLLCGYEFM